MENRFDEMAKAMATGVSRREALRRVAGGFAGAALASLGLSRGRAWADGNPDKGNDACAHWCHDVAFPGPGPDAGKCTSAAAKGTGPCYECGPAAPLPHGDICAGVCCAVGQTCINGACVNNDPCVCTPGTGFTCPGGPPATGLHVCGTGTFPDGTPHCVCATTKEGNTVCVLTEPAACNIACTTSAFCNGVLPGSVCVVNTCCPSAAPTDGFCGVPCLPAFCSDAG